MTVERDPRASSARDAAAGEQLERLYRELLLRFCRGYLPRREDAEDAASEVLIKALETREQPDDLRPWLLRVARNHCLNKLRDLAPREHEPLASDADWIASATGALTKLERGDERAQLGRLLERLTPHERELLRLRYGEDLSREDVAAVLDLPVSVVKSRLFEALAKLRGAARAPG